MKPFITLICVGLLMSSCASIFCGSKAKVTFDGEISEEATLTIDGLKHTNVTFPYTTKILKLAHIRMDFRGIMQSAWTRKG